MALDVLVAELRELDGRSTEPPHAVGIDRLLKRLDRRLDFALDGLARARLGGTIVVALGEQKRPVQEVPERADQFVVDALLEAVPREVDVGGELAAGDDVVPIEVGIQPRFDVVVGPDRSVPGGRKGLPVEIDEPTRHHGSRLVEARTA